MTSTATERRTTQDIAKKLVDQCSHGKSQDFIREFYDENIVSIEAVAKDNLPREVRGLSAVMEKQQNWSTSMTVHRIDIAPPLVAGDRFAVKFSIDATCKTTHERCEMEEIGVYQVKNGKIVREEFFYNTDEKV